MHENLKNLSTQIAMTNSIEFANEDLEDLYALIQELIQVAVEARTQGLLAIENHETEYFLLRKGIKLICSGTDPLIVEQILGKFVISGHYNGKDLVARLIIMDGIYGIQYGENPYRIHDLLTAWLGESFAVEYDEYIGDEELTKKIERIRKRLSNDSVD